MAKKDKGGKEPRSCPPHRNVTKTIYKVPGHTRPIKVIENRCHDCGAHWNETS